MTPTATKVALVVTLVVTAAAFAAFLASADTPVEPEDAAPCLWLYSALFLVRVVGQLVARRWHPSWLPPTEHWNLSPYHLLLPTQLVILGVMVFIDVSFSVDEGPAVTPRPTFGWIVLGFAAVYASAMAVRYAVRMTRRPAERWFDGTIPIVPREMLGVIPIQLFGLALSPVPAPRLLDRIGVAMRRLAVGDLRKYGIGKAEWGPFTQRRPPVIDVGFLRLLKRRQIEVLPEVTGLTADSVRFRDGSERPFDVVVAATGFDTGGRARANDTAADVRLGHGRPTLGRSDRREDS